MKEEGRRRSLNLSRSRDFDFGFSERNRFDDSACLQAAGAYLDTPHSTIRKTDFDPLEIGEEAAPGNSGDLFPNTAGLFGQTAAGNRASYQRVFIADFTVLHGGTL